MIDAELVRKKLAVIESCMQELKTLGRSSEIQIDLRELRFEACTRQISIQAALDIAAHVVAGERMARRKIIYLLLLSQDS